MVDGNYTLTPPPAVLLKDGKLLELQMRREGIIQDEIEKWAKVIQFAALKPAG